MAESSHNFVAAIIIHHWVQLESFVDVGVTHLACTQWARPGTMGRGTGSGRGKDSRALKRAFLTFTMLWAPTLLKSWDRRWGTIGIVCLRICRWFRCCLVAIMCRIKLVYLHILLNSFMSNLWGHDCSFSIGGGGGGGKHGTCPLCPTLFNRLCGIVTEKGKLYGVLYFYPKKDLTTRSWCCVAEARAFTHNSGVAK